MHLICTQSRCNGVPQLALPCDPAQDAEQADKLHPHLLPSLSAVSHAERQARAAAAQESSRSLAAARTELQRWEQQDATTRRDYEER